MRPGMQLWQPPRLQSTLSRLESAGRRGVTSTAADPNRNPAGGRALANRNIAAARSVDKPTFIYGLVDPLTHQLRYIGKTVLSPEKRLSVHLWRARAHPHKLHSMAWLISLGRAGAAPQVFVIEEIPAGQDWVEAEQFWIAYFRMIGADLCNHTLGGEGRHGQPRSPEEIAKMKVTLPRGKDHHAFGKPMPAATAAALAEGGRKLRADPIRNANAIKARRAGMTAEAMAPCIAGLRRANADPVKRASIRAKVDEKLRAPTSRARVSAQSFELWATKRAEIIAAQNAGKDEQWRAQNSERVKAEWKKPGNKLLAAMARRRVLSDDDVRKIRARIAGNESLSKIAAEYGVDNSLISHIKAGRKR